MAYDEDRAEAMRELLAGHQGIDEKRMFGGLCFLLNGNLLCGVHKGGGMFRVGKANEAAALAIEGVRPLDFTGRRMGGLVDVDDDLLDDAARCERLLALALDFVAPLPAK